MSILAENEKCFLAEIAVAPLVGAWIETYPDHRDGPGDRVAPLVGARIETSTRSTTGSSPSSRSFAGARIEIVDQSDGWQRCF